MKKFYEKMIVTNGKLQFAIEMPSEIKNERPTYIIIRDGRVYFENSWYNSVNEYNTSDESHQIAKQIFMNALQFDVKQKISELKLLESILTDIGLVDLLGSSLTEGQKILISQQIREEIDTAKETIKQETKEEVVKVIKPRAIKKEKAN